MKKQFINYLIFVYISGFVIFLISIWKVKFTSEQMLYFSVLTSLAVLTQSLKGDVKGKNYYRFILAFCFAGIFLLQPFFFNIMVIVLQLVAIVKERYSDEIETQPWYLHVFYINTYIIVAAVAKLVYGLLNPHFESMGSISTIIAVLITGAVFVLIDRLFIGEAFVFTKGALLKDTGIIEAEDLKINYAMVLQGFLLAMILESSYWLVIPALATLYLVYRSLSVPNLKKQANTDGKTGLWNAAYFFSELEKEIERAKRKDTQVTVVIADIDLLRNINNTYGHLAGDAVLKGSAGILLGSFRKYDLIARFGGEEFAMMIPDSHPKEVFQRVEKVRKLIEKEEFISPVTYKKVKATMSFGIAGMTEKHHSAVEIIHCADIAVYAAKLKGRNQTCMYSEEIAYTLEKLEKRSITSSPYLTN